MEIQVIRAQNKKEGSSLVGQKGLRNYPGGQQRFTLTNRNDLMQTSGFVGKLSIPFYSQTESGWELVLDYFYWDRQ